MNTTILAWAAGILDGEGHVGIHSSPQKLPYTHRRFNLRVEIGMTHKETIQFLIDNFGFRLFVREHKAPRKTCYFAHISSNQVANFLRLVQPYCITKREQIKIALDFHKTCMAGHPSGKKLLPEQVALRESFYAKMRIANDWHGHKKKS